MFVCICVMGNVAKFSASLSLLSLSLLPALSTDCTTEIQVTVCTGCESYPL